MHPLPVRPLGSQTSVLPRTGMNCSFSSFVCMKFPPRLLNKWMRTFLEFLKSQDLKGYFARVERFIAQPLAGIPDGCQAKGVEQISYQIM